MMISIIDRHYFNSTYHKMCVGDEESNISTKQMLTNIEICMEELLCFMERTPKEKLDEAEKVKEQERKDQLKKEALELGKQLTEERRKREIERANADVKPKRGKQLVFRCGLGLFMLFLFGKVFLSFFFRFDLRVSERMD